MIDCCDRSLYWMIDCCDRSLYWMKAHADSSCSLLVPFHSGGSWTTKVVFERLTAQKMTREDGKVVRKRPQAIILDVLGPFAMKEFHILSREKKQFYR